jgi:exonuclease SbcC
MRRKANPKAISLPTYVFMRRFEDVVAAANARLRVMSRDRYSLEPNDEKELGSKSRKLGLSLLVHDHEVEKTRDPKSISGGETFYASLMLSCVRPAHFRSQRRKSPRGC